MGADCVDSCSATMADDSQMTADILFEHHEIIKLKYDSYPTIC